MKKTKQARRAIKAARAEAQAAQAEGVAEKQDGPKPIPFKVQRRPWFPRTVRKIKIRTLLKLIKWLGHRPGAVSTGADGREYVLLLDGSIRRLYRRGE